MTTEFSLRPVDDVKGVLVLVPPSQSDGRNAINEPDWTAFADKHKLALVGCFFRDDFPTFIEKYCDLRRHRAGEHLMAYIAGCGLAGKPIFLWGFSAGGQFAYEFACAYPKDTKGFVLNKGGIYYTALASEEARQVPGLLIYGTRDSLWRQHIIQGIYWLNTTAGANWKLHPELNEGHSIGDSEELGRDFFEGLLGGKL